MTKTFKDLKLPEFMLRTCKQIGLNTPTPVQEATIPQILSGKNIVAISPTGSGKTAAFALPIISKLSEDPYGIFCLTLSPTRELGEQIRDQFKLFGSGMAIDVAEAFGGLSYNEQALVIEKKPHILVATPGRLLSHLKNATDISFKYLKFLVLDEVDRLYNQGFWKDIEQILTYLPSNRQTLLYSATMNETIPLECVLTKPGPITRCNFTPNEFQRLSEDGNTFFWKPAADQAPKITHVKVSMPPSIREVYLIIILEDIMKNNQYSQVLVFTSHCESAQELGLILRKMSFKTAIIHSKMEQDERFKAIKDFKAGSQRILVATDVAARGLDIPFVDDVIHYNPPSTATIYVHRAGRTGRAGREGRSVLFVNGERDAKIVGDIEKEIGHELEVMKIDEKETIGRMKTVLTAKRDANMNMFENNFGEREKRIREIREVQEMFSIDGDNK
ncbi:DEAD/DEAH box helicase family protein [Tritrichomonas foetus]|uniref:DEAD/DEAH box helicase family protein n=1 Tax=Tritrichomonas foetus TaxID=1144522 RepID=A0A1J4JBU5_9EUKA|nr:DEAD/DEAH box helicase family protein [Tritrichomonas foetus]|eukprot:OHS95719.1 DEAD/DEAH box helicase family protein [Tritrichomonas foetus]